MLHRALLRTRVVSAFSSTRGMSSRVDDAQLFLREAASSARNFIRGSLLSTMATRMPPKEAQELAEAWGYLSSKDAMSDSAPVCAANEEKKEVPPPVLDLAAVTPDHSNWTHFLPKTSSASTIDVELLHPVFGELQADLGHKRLYLSSIYALSRAQVWERQRILRPQRAAQIAREKVRQAERTGRNISLSGVITLYQDENTGESGIVDGQHRVAAVVLLAQQGHWDMHTRNVSVDVIRTRSDDEVSSLFKEINCAEPVRLVDMPSKNAVDGRRKALLEEAIEVLAEEYPVMFSTSARCRRPHVNADKMRDDLYQSGVLNKMRTAKQLGNYLRRVNRALMKNSSADWSAMLGSTVIVQEEGQEVGVESRAEMPPGFDAALEKARRHGFFLGMTDGWLSK